MNVEDEVDPLDAYMASIGVEVAKYGVKTTGKGFQQASL